MAAYEIRLKGGAGPPVSDFFVHGGGIVLPDGFRHLYDFHSHGACAQGNFDSVAYLDLVAGLDDSAVDTDPAVIAGLVGYGAAFDQAGYL